MVKRISMEEVLDKVVCLHVYRCRFHKGLCVAKDVKALIKYCVEESDHTVSYPIPLLES